MEVLQLTQFLLEQKNIFPTVHKNKNREQWLKRQKFASKFSSTEQSILGTRTFFMMKMHCFLVFFCE